MSIQCQFIIARGLLDSGSQSSFITHRIIKKLNLKTFDNNLTVMGISENITRIQKSVNLNIESCVYHYMINVNCAVADKITTNLPQFEFDTGSINIPNNIVLSDTSFNKPGNIDVLLGANVFFQILLTGTIKLGTNNLVLQNTLFGFVAS
ncbi:hypothetical protein ILUMI_18677, partial [Ignelater luminosus]